MTVHLTDRQTGLLALAADNRGLIHVTESMSPADRKAADALVRCGLLSPGAYSARHLTDHGRRTLANLTVGRAAAILARHLDGTRRQDHAYGAADDLHRAGYLTGGTRAGAGLLDEAAAVLACRYDPPTAERMARDLSDAGLLAGQKLPEEE
ncbi:hypothetical protein ABZ671_01095 [Micromonospora sp. NPDC006766]|uniref:hypothetical protein n=1 Tax=Micromonospora sp. NPDC006766 TaxID=3154778 RepID=UPI00340CC382